MYSWESSYNNVDLFGNNNSDEDEEIILYKNLQEIMNSLLMNTKIIKYQRKKKIQ